MIYVLVGVLLGLVLRVAGLLWGDHRERRDLMARRRSSSLLTEPADTFAYELFDRMAKGATDG